jgi:hypothetical protein
VIAGCVVLTPLRAHPDTHLSCAVSEAAFVPALLCLLCTIMSRPVYTYLMHDTSRSCVSHPRVKPSLSSPSGASSVALYLCDRCIMLPRRIVLVVRRAYPVDITLKWKAYTCSMLVPSTLLRTQLACVGCSQCEPCSVGIYHLRCVVCSQVDASHCALGGDNLQSRASRSDVADSLGAGLPN